MISSQILTINLFEAIKILRQALAKSLKKMLDKYGLRKKNIGYVKDEGSNFNSLTIVLKSIVSCESFELEETFQSTCFGHAFQKHVIVALQRKKSTKI
jgi:hypothetical protein